MPRGTRAKCVCRLQASRNGRPSHARTASKKCFWRNQSKMFQVSPKKEAKTAGVVIAGLHPLLRQTANHRTRKLKKAAWCSQTQSNISSVYQEKCIFCAAFKLIKHASVTDARSSWSERCRALMYSAFIHVAACHATCWTVFPGLSAAARPEQPLCG